MLVIMNSRNISVEIIMYMLANRCVIGWKQTYSYIGTDILKFKLPIKLHGARGSAVGWGKSRKVKGSILGGVI
jgi:hypothetical protein